MLYLSNTIFSRLPDGHLASADAKRGLHQALDEGIPELLLRIVLLHDL